MLIFSHLSFADEMTCDSIFKEIEELNEQQLKFKLSEQGATYENILKEYKVEMPILSILTNLKIKNINDISKLSQEETARNLVSYSKISTKCKKDATELTKECSEFLNSYLEGNLDGLIDAYKKTELNYKKALSKIQDSLIGYDDFVCDEVYELLKYFLTLSSLPSTMAEWDDNIPDLKTYEEEVLKINQFL